MPFDPVATLFDRLSARNGAWPARWVEDAWRTVRRRRAFLESDRDALRRIADWGEDDADRRYKVDPLGERIAEAWQDYTFAEDPTFTAAGATDEGPGQDQGRIDELVDDNDLPEEFRAAEHMRVGEGEVWWRIASVDPDVADHALIEFHSRLSVIPLFVGRRLLAAALVSELEGPGYTASGSLERPARDRVYRHFEVHVEGAVEHRLYRGTTKRLGGQVALERHPELEELAGNLEPTDDELAGRWNHGLAMLMGRLVNKRGRKIGLGRSDFDRIEDYLLELNEALSIGGENMRLTAKKRAVVDESVLANDGATTNYNAVDRGDGVLVPDTVDGTLDTPRRRPRLDAGADLLVATKLDSDLGNDPANIFKVLEYSYDAEALIAHKRDLVESALTRIGLTPVWVGTSSGDSSGYAISGTHLRLRMIPTERVGAGKARPWDQQAPRIISLAAQVEALPIADGGLGIGWTDATALPAFERADALPVDEVEESTVTSTLVSARVMSRREAIKRRHPDWDKARVDEELDAIDADNPPASAGLGAGF